ncbi:helix-turn-helix transcriptional regulator [Saccharopolyspora taberi]|uniref:HTH cro/C1-type domain-containing protein n=1 Tax=Saccharopolyspora taberi TaxID=60895 RepID=A0ABN3VA18_9PSEU
MCAASSAKWAAFGSRVRELRRTAGWTQAQLGRRVGYDRTLLSRVERGAREPSPWLAARLDEAFGTGRELAVLRAAADRYGRPVPLATTLLQAVDDVVPAGLELPRWPEFLNTDVTPCVLHGRTRCPVPAAAEAGNLVRQVVSGGIGSRVHTDAVHALVSLLESWLRGYDRPWQPGALAAVEPIAHGIARWAQAVGGDAARPLWQLAAEYAHRAGVARTDIGYPLVGITWLTLAMQWADHSGSAGTRVLGSAGHDLADPAQRRHRHRAALRQRAGRHRRPPPVAGRLRRPGAIMSPRPPGRRAGSPADAGNRAPSPVRTGRGRDGRGALAGRRR